MTTENTPTPRQDDGQDETPQAQTTQDQATPAQPTQEQTTQPQTTQHQPEESTGEQHQHQHQQEGAHGHHDHHHDHHRGHHGAHHRPDAFGGPGFGGPGGGFGGPGFGRPGAGGPGFGGPGVDGPGFGGHGFSPEDGEEQGERLMPRFRRLGGLLRHRGHARLHEGRRGGPQGPAADPTQGQGRILAALKLRDGIPTKDLAFILGVRVPSLNELLGKLEKAGYITREPSEEDRRVVLIHLTEAGRDAEQTDPQQAHEEAFSVLDEEERAQLRGYLDRIIEHLEETTEFPAPERERFEQWAQKARARMGEEQFEQWISAMEERFGEGGPRRFGRR